MWRGQEFSIGHFNSENPNKQKTIKFKKITYCDKD